MPWVTIESKVSWSVAIQVAARERCSSALARAAVLCRASFEGRPAALAAQRRTISALSKVAPSVIALAADVAPSLMPVKYRSRPF